MSNDVQQSPALLVFSNNDEVLSCVDLVASKVRNLSSYQTIKATTKQAIATLRSMDSPSVLVVDITDHEQPQILLTDLSQVCDANVKVVVLGDVHHVDFYRQLLGMGVSEYLTLPLDTELLLQTFNRLLITNQVSSARTGQWVSVVGCGGGVGATTLVAQLARGLALKTYNTLAVDGDYHYGNLDIHFDAAVHYSMADLVREHQSIDALVSERASTQVTSHLSLMKGRGIDTGILPQEAIELSNALPSHYDYVMCDMSLNALVMPGNDMLLDSSNVVVVVLTPTLSGLREAKLILAACENLGAKPRIITVLNNVIASSYYAISPAQVAQHLARNVDVVLPYAPAAVICSAELAQSLLSNKGVLSKRLNALVDLVTVGTDQAPTKYWWQPAWLLRQSRTHAQEV